MRTSLETDYFFPAKPETDGRYNLLVLKQCLKAKINNTTTISHSSPCGPVTVPVKQRVSPLIRNSFSRKERPPRSRLGVINPSKLNGGV